MNTEIKSFTTLKTQSELMLRASRKNDKAINKDSDTLAPLIVNYLKDIKSNDEWSLARITATIYDAVGYDSRGIDKQGESMKSPSFETRVKRATFDALLEFYQVNPNAVIEYDDNGKVSKDNRLHNEDGYKRNNEGKLVLAHNILMPTIEQDIDGEKQELPNNDTTEIVVVSRLREKHFGNVFKGLSKRGGGNGTGQVDYEQMLIDLNTYLIKLSNKDLIKLLAVGNQNGDEKTPFEKHLETLENTIGKVFEKKSGLVLTEQGNIVDTNPAVVNG